MLKVTFPSNKLQELIPCINVRDFINEKKIITAKNKEQPIQKTHNNNPTKFFITEISWLVTERNGKNFLFAKNSSS